MQIKDSLTISTLEPIDNFDIHKSLNYILITTKDGSIHLFSLKTKEFVFKYSLEMRVKSSFVDPSGLYLIACGVSPKMMRTTLSMNCKMLITSASVMIIEIGTGLTYKSGMSPFGVTCFEWSKDGKFVYMGTEQGRVIICEAEEEIKENILDALDLIKSNHFFWDNFGIGSE